MEPEGSLLPSQEPSTGPQIFHNEYKFVCDTFNTPSSWASYDHSKLLGTERYWSMGIKVTAQ
jgi:hypothetical protein